MPLSALTASTPFAPVTVPADQPFVPVILGGDIGAYSLAREFHEAYGAISVVVPSMVTGVVNHSRILQLRPFAAQDDHPRFLDFLLGLGAELAGVTGATPADAATGPPSAPTPRRPLMLFGAADPHIRFLVSHAQRLETLYTVPYVGEDLLRRTTLKDSFRRLCREHGVGHPATAVLDLTAGAPEQTTVQAALRAEQVPFPAIVKAADSVAWGSAHFEGKLKVHRVDDLAELTELLGRAAAGGYRGSVVVQDLIPGGDDAMRLITVFADRAGTVRFASPGRVLLEEHAPGALGNSAAIVAEPEQQITAQAVRLVESLGWTGFCMFDAVRDPRDGELKFFELNPRLGRNHYYVTAAGHNVARCYVEHFLPARTVAAAQVMAGARGAAPSSGCVAEGPDDGPTVPQARHLYSVLPRRVLLKYTPRRLHGLIKDLYRQGAVTHPFAYRAETDPRRWAYIAASRLNQFRKFARFHPGVA